MAQYNSRLCIVYVDGNLSWLRVRAGLEKIKIEKYGFEAGSQDTIFEPKRNTGRAILDEFSCSDEELEKLVTEISKKLKAQGIIIADTTDYNVNPYVSGVYYAGDGIKSFYYDESDPLCELQEKVKISDVAKWFEKAVCSVTDKENKRIKKCGYKPKLSISEEENQEPKPSKNVAMIYVAFSDRETANTAFSRWIVMREPDGSEYSVLDPKCSSLTLFEAAKKRCLLGEIYGMDEKSCKEYLEKYRDLFDPGCSLGIAWNGRDPEIYVVYAFGDGIKERNVSAPDLKGKIKDGLSFDEAIRCSDIRSIFGEDLSDLEEAEKKKLKECELI